VTVKKIFSAILILIFAGTISGCVAESSTGIEIGNKAPDFELIGLDGSVVSLSGLKGKPVFINFWSVN